MLKACYYTREVWDFDRLLTANTEAILECAHNICMSRHVCGENQLDRDFSYLLFPGMKRIGRGVVRNKVDGTRPYVENLSESNGVPM